MGALSVTILFEETKFVFQKKKGTAWDKSCLSWKVPHRTLPLFDRGNYLLSREGCHSVSENVQIREKGFFMTTNKVWNEAETCCKN